MIGSKIIGQYTCIIAKMYAVLMPNSSMPPAGRIARLGTILTQGMPLDQNKNEADRS